MVRLPAATGVLAAVLVLSVLALSGPAGAADAPATDLADRPDPSGDPIGWEGGYWYNESIDVDQSDGLSETERDAFVSRAMARVERIRGAEFERDVPVSVRTRVEFEAERDTAPRERYDAWNNQVWAAPLIVGEDRDANALLDSLYGGSVAGYYDPASDEIVIVADEDGDATIDNATLVHELTHTLQDQRYNLSAPRYTGDTQDEDLAAQGIVEGEAGYVETRYAQYCAGEWDCVSAPDSATTATPENLGMYATVFQPYSDGPAYVDALREQGGWEAVNETMTRPPNATAQTIHVTNQTPVAVRFNDTARDGWETYPEFGENGSDTVGEAAIFSGFWHQTRAYGANVVDTRRFYRGSGPYDAYNYTAAPSEGWAGDRLFPYRHPESGGDGYVWATRWDSGTEADEFAAAYVRSLSAHDARPVAPNTYVVGDGPFADAYHVRHNGTRVRIVNGPTVSAVHDIRPATAATNETNATHGTPTNQPTGPSSNATVNTISTTTTNRQIPSAGTTESGPVPGFGTLAALVALWALLLAGLLRGHR